MSETVIANFSRRYAVEVGASGGGHGAFAEWEFSSAFHTMDDAEFHAEIIGEDYEHVRIIDRKPEVVES